MKKKITISKLIFLSLAFYVMSLLFNQSANNYKVIAAENTQTASDRFWDVQSIDVMKYSRDTARAEANNPEFEQIIAEQVKAIKDAGATHIAIGTPYDEEFIPFMKKWVSEARANGLNVWYRGNWAGWEEWFEYPKISREEHLQKTEAFILAHPELFKDGDIFTPCPECENGGPGDPRFKQGQEELDAYRQFLIDLHIASTKSFKKINKNVHSGYFSMNGDVARLVMDPQTTNKLENMTVVDHYVYSSQKLSQDVTDYAQNSQGKVILGEFGVPIPDIHGDSTQEEQAKWLEETLALLSKNPNLSGLNYWTLVGGSTEIWTDGPRPAYEVLKKYYKPKKVELQVLNEIGNELNDATIKYGSQEYTTDEEAKLHFLYVDKDPTISVDAPGYENQIVQLKPYTQTKVILQKTDENFIFKLRKWLKSLQYN